MLLLASLALGLLYATTPYPAFAARITAPNYGLVPGQEFPLTPERYAALRLGLAATALVAAAGLVASRRRGRRAVRGRRPPPTARWVALSRNERLVAGAVLLAAAGVHLWYAFGYPLTLDEVASYDFAVLPGAALTASYYPFPNNHLLPNLLVGAVHGLLPGADALLALRLLPTLLGLVVLGLGYELLLRYLPFSVATLSWGLFSLSPLPAFYAVAGRGYGWALAALLAGLAASLVLLQPRGAGRRRRQRAWVVFGLSAVLGLYAVPTHLYALLGLGLALLVGFSRGRGRGRRLRWLHLAVLTLGVGLVVAVLYAPVVAVSGWPALVANRYVLRLSPAEFWPHVGPYYLLGTASELLGQRLVSALFFVAVAALTPLVLTRGHLPEPTRRLGWLAYAQLLLWLGLVLGQRVYPPARTLLAVLLFLFVLVALAAQVGLGWGWPRARRQPTPRRVLAALVAVLAGYGGYRLHREQVVIGQQARQQQELRRAYRWLRARHPRRVWLPESARAYALFWNHYALNAGEPPLPLVLAGGVMPAHIWLPRPGPAYKLQLARPAGRPAAYADAHVVLLPLATEPLP